MLRTVDATRTTGGLGTGSARVMARINWRAVVLIACLVLLWQVGAQFTSDLLIVPPSAVIDRATEMADQGFLWSDIRISTVEFLLGFALACGVGIPLAFAIGASRNADIAVQPLLNGAYSVPIIAFGPIFIIGFGIGIFSKVLVVALSAIFPILINITSGVKETPAEYLELSRSLNHSRYEVITKIIFPSTLPYVMVGLRLGAARGLVGVLGGELFGATGGVGYRLLTSAQSFDTAGIYVGVMYFLAFGILISAIFRACNARFTRYREAENRE